MSSADIWLTILGLTVITLITRGFFLFFGSRIELSDTIQRALRYAPMAALVAVIAPEVLLIKQDGHFTMQLFNPQMWGGIAAVLIFLRFRHMVGTIVGGMVVYTAVRFLPW